MLPSSISSSLFSCSSLFQRQVKNQFYFFPFSFYPFYKGKTLSPFKIMTPNPASTGDHTAFLVNAFKSVMSQNSQQNLLYNCISSFLCFQLELLAVPFGEAKPWHFVLLFDRYKNHPYEEIRQLDLFLQSDGNDNYFVHNNLKGLNCEVKLWNVNTFLYRSLEERGPQYFCLYHGAEHILTVFLEHFVKFSSTGKHRMYVRNLEICFRKPRGVITQLLQFTDMFKLYSATINC